MADPAPVPSILVLGSGELGIAMLRALAPRAAGAGLRVDVAVRSESGGESVRALGLTPVQLDIASASESELAERFSRYDTVLSCIGFAAGSGTQLELARAALASGVRRYFPWQFGVDYDVLGRGSPQPLFDEQLDVRDLLRGQHGMRWVIVSVGMFTSFLFEPAFGVVDLERGVVRALGSWDNAVTVTTPEDIGRLTTEILLAEPEFGDGVVHVAGDTITYERLADVVGRVLDRPIEREVWTIPELMKALDREPDDTLRRYRAVFATGRGIAWDKADTFNGRRGLPTIDAEGWLRGHLKDRNDPLQGQAS